MSVESIVIIGADWCGDCHRVKRLFENKNIPYQWKDINKDKEAEQIVLDINHGRRIIPTILFKDGSSLVEPSNSTLVTKLGLLE